MLIGFLASLVVLRRQATAATGDERTARRVMLPWLALLLFLAIAAVMIFMLPMEMRGAPGFTG